MVKALLLSTKHLFSILLISFLCFSCSSENALKNFDSKAWKDDWHACQKNRETQIKTILDQKEVLLSMDARKISSLLGSPNITSLNKRMGKIYIYNIYPDTTCGGLKNNKMLHIELEPLGKVKLVTVK